MLETQQTCPKQNDHARKPQVVWKTGTQTELVESENRESRKEKVKGEEGKKGPQSGMTEQREKRGGEMF